MGFLRWWKTAATAGPVNADENNPLPVSAPAVVTQLTKAPGAQNWVIIVTSLSATGAIAPARPTRRGAIIKNTHASAILYVGPSGVGTGTGFELKAGESLPVSFTGAIHAVPSTGTIIAHVTDEYD